MSNYLSYGQILKDKLEFKKSGTKSGNEINLFDTPSHKYFKILFYFGDSSENANEYGNSNGLLHPTWEIFPKQIDNSENNTVGESVISTKVSKPKNVNADILKLYDYNSAWSYLKLNDEEERAEKLEKFVSLLSNINSYSPWYFTSISGLDTAMERTGQNGKFDIGDDLKTITINCLPDSFDNRIGTLLELYRDIVWSWVNKKEIVPANLRKFDMGVYLFESNIGLWHDENDIIGDDSNYITSYKMLEFHDCEFNYNSIKSGWGTVDNQTGITPTYTIDISYSDCYEISYNEQLMRKIGDVILTDTYQAVMKDEVNIINDDFISKSQEDSSKQKSEFNKRLNFNNLDYFYDDSIYSLGNLEEKHTKRDIVYKSDDPIPGFIENAVGQVVGTAKSFVESKLKRAVLGNLYTYSLTKIGSQLSDVMQGNLIKTGQSVKQYIDNAQQRAAAKVKKSGNLGNIYNKNTIANN